MDQRAEKSDIIISATVAGDDDGSANKAVCKLCNRQYARYTCPTCNIPYCSLTCFRGEAHSQCSEAFYKREIQSDIKTRPSATQEERTRMLTLLKKFEEDDLGDDAVRDLMGEDTTDGEGDDEVGDEGEDLAQRLAGVDLNSASSEEIWHLLTPMERKAFENTMNDPSSDLARSLLSSDLLEAEQSLPWWEGTETIEYGDESASDRAEPKRWSRGRKPEMLQVPASLLRPVGLPSGPALLYNIFVVTLAYVYVTRHLVTSPLAPASSTHENINEISENFKNLLPFLIDKRSTAVFTSVKVGTADFWSRLGDSELVLASTLPPLLLDARNLVSPSRLSVVLPDEEESQATNLGIIPPSQLLTHGSSNLFLALSDTAHVFEHLNSSVPVFSSGKPSPYAHVVHKLKFYMAYIKSLPAEIMFGLGEEIRQYADALVIEGAQALQ